MNQREINMEQYYQLIEEKEKYQNQKVNFFEKDRKNYLKLLEYQVIFENEVYFNQRQSYLELIENYLNHQCDAESFHVLFYQMWRQDRDQVKVFEQQFHHKKVPVLKINLKAESFSKLIDSIFNWGEIFTNAEPDNINEEKFRKKIEKIFLEMQDLLNRN